MNKYKHLHIIIKDIFEQFGENVLSKPVFVNLLLDFGAFKEIPLTKPIMQYMLNEGYLIKIADMLFPKTGFMGKLHALINSSNSTYEPSIMLEYTKEISQGTKIKEEFVKYSLDSILYGAGIIKDVDLPTIGQNLAKGNNQSTASIHTEIIDTDTQFLIFNIIPTNAILTIDNTLYTLQNGMFAGEFSIGIHNYTVELPQYQTISGQVELKTDVKTELDIALPLINNAVCVSITSEDDNTEILINGISKGYGKIDIVLPEGNYNIESRRDKFYPLIETYDIFGKNKTISLGKLSPMYGSLKVNVTPVGCNVYMNGNSIGTTPLMKKNISIGEKHIRVVHPEGTEISTLINIEENKISVYNCDIPSIVLTDYTELNVGDWYYDDGSFSHKRVNNKKAIGIVFSLKTGLEEKKRGWTHGQIIALEPHREHFEWSKNNYIQLQETIENISLVNAVNKLISSKDPSSLFKGYEISKLDLLENNSDFPLFLSVQKLKKDMLPKGKTSGWYIPNLYQCLEMAINLHDISLQNSYIRDSIPCKPKKTINAEVYKIIGGFLDTWTSSSKNNEEAWNFSMCEFNNTIHSGAQSKKIGHHPILVASF